MNKLFVIYKKDLYLYFHTLIGYVFCAAILLAGGIYVYINNFYYGAASFGESINSVPFFYIFMIPILSAGIFTDEKRQKTDQLLHTLPFTPAQVVIGKYLALITTLLLPIVIIGIYPLIMALYGKVNFAQAYLNLLAVFLLGAALCAICMFISNFSGNIIISAIVCFAVMFLLHQMNTFSSVLSMSANRSFIGLMILVILFFVFLLFMTKNIYISLIPTIIIAVALYLIRHFSQYAFSGKLNTIMSAMAVFDQLNNFKLGIFDLYVIIYYLSIIVLFVTFTMFTFERERWMS